MNPYLLGLPAVVSFSGGRTSGLMLRRILDAHDGQPPGLEVCFQNTGLEHEATLEFIRDVAAHWHCRITWLEYCVTDGKHDYRTVCFDNASRNGEPFTALILKKGYLPNPRARICTLNLKIRTMDRHLRGLPDFSQGYTNAIGLRADEAHRVHRMKPDHSREEIVHPLYRAGIEEPDVLEFWAKQPFDLMLPMRGNVAGNCVGCFLKGPRRLDALMREMPEHFDWWVRAEELLKTKAGTGASFRSDRKSYAAMLETSKRQTLLPYAFEDDGALPCHCTD